MHPKYNLKFDNPDSRDFYYEKNDLKELPAFVDLKNLCSPVENQGQIGSCTANALVGNLEFLENKNKSNYVDLSRLFIYYNERFVENTVAQDAGATLRDGIKVLKNYGVCTEKIWPYEEKPLLLKPSATAYDAALDNRVSRYERLTDLHEFRDCLSQGFPFVFGIEVFDSIESPEVAESGFIPMPRVYETKLGGHALLAVGYDDKKELLIIRNSWGTNWGVNGYGWIPYDYLRTYGADFWVVRK
jgi:C1A family cysteine protease